MPRGSLAVRISDAERHDAEYRLRDACAEGRITVDELTHRLDLAYSARTRADLAPVLSDLPKTRAQPGYAPLVNRVVSFFVDEAIVVGGAAAVGYVLQSTAAFVAVLVVLHLIYYTLLHGSAPGQTVGNRLVGTAVKTRDGGRLTYTEACGRTIAKFASFAFWPIGGFMDFLWPLWDKRRQALHDKVAGSVVVNRRWPGARRY